VAYSELESKAAMSTAKKNSFILPDFAKSIRNNESIFKPKQKPDFFSAGR
jgi:hypothetical protein